jgi:hypothetical protein
MMLGFTVDSNFVAVSIPRAHCSLRYQPADSPELCYLHTADGKLKQRSGFDTISRIVRCEYELLADVEGHLV